MNQQPNKLAGVLRSRKFWAAVLSIAGTFGVDAVKDLDPDTLVFAIETIGGVYIGSIAVEDGLTHLAEGVKKIVEWYLQNASKLPPLPTTGPQPVVIGAAQG